MSCVKDIQVNLILKNLFYYKNKKPKSLKNNFYPKYLKKF